MGPSGNTGAASDPEQRGEGEDELQERLEAVNVPSRAQLPPPPKVEFERPTLGRGTPGRSFSSSGNSGVSGGGTGEGGPSHLGASLVIGITFPSCVIVGASIGIWMDHHWGNPNGTPWWTIVMSLAGIAAGFMNIFRVVSRIDRSEKKKKG